METLDCRGQQCPQPVVQARRFMLAQPGSAFQILVDDAASRDNLRRLGENQGYTTEVTAQENDFLIALTPGDAQPVPSAKEPAAGPTVILVGSDQMGNGDPKLGQILMKNFIFTLVEGDSLPDLMLFVNTGIKLTVGGSDVLEPLEQLAEQGVEIASCGLCLEYFELKESLAVGRISNMLETVNALNTAGRLIRP
ncbi:MAG TPA: sulfurtransferase-like selenium metabolism protein YedF [Desulfuromonadales bacterium]|nr:sulfurtransferase-like selenium metabolism protein YedF [Desulfuromonadales bacterium]